LQLRSCEFGGLGLQLLLGLIGATALELLCSPQLSFKLQRFGGSLQVSLSVLLESRFKFLALAFGI